MEKKKPIILSVIALLALVALVVGATFAYFQAQVGEGKSADVVVKSYTVDTFTFSTGSQISLNLDQDNFASGKGNITGSTYASATLTANNKTNTATEHYYLYLNIENNTFTYSINESTPEIIMTITDNAGTEVTDITGLTHTSVTDANGTQVSGYDITNKNGLITLFNNREITTTSSKEERWNIKVTFVNYDASQNANAGKSMSAKVMIQKEVMPFHQTCNDNTLACHTAKLYTGTQGENSIYYHDANLANGAGDNSYRFAGARDKVNNYLCFGSTQSPCPADNLYRIIGVFDGRVKLIKSDYATSALLVTDGDYNTSTYSKSSVSTYKGELTTINRYTWNYKNNTTINNGFGSNTWSTSLLNKTNLNQNFITKVGAEWTAKIDETTWKVGGNAYDNIASKPAKTAYQNEIVKPAPGNYSTNGDTEYKAQIGLMYASDYGFAAAPSAWTTDLKSYHINSIPNSNWMYMGIDEWTISRFAEFYTGVLYVNASGRLCNGSSNDALAVRPVFNLTSSVNYASGSGSATDPILVN
jgi:hypothetical protein